MSDPGVVELVVGRVGKPHGVRGEVSVEVRTDEPERRFADGTVLQVQAPAQAPPDVDRPARLTVSGTRWHQARLLVRFAEVTGRTAAEALRGSLLTAQVDTDDRPDDPDEFYDHQLVGLAAVTTDGRHVGEVAEVVHAPGQDLLSVRAEDGREVLVPFVSALVPRVDLEDRTVHVTDLPGLLSPAVTDEEGGA
jgi:16S rRNA processing protein RimM